MDSKKVLSYLEQNGIGEVEEIQYKDDVLVLRFFYDFDDEEITSARAYADDECEEETESDEWYEEYFLPYLNEIAVDNVGEIMEEIMESIDMDVQYVTYEADMDNYDYCEFIVLVAPKNSKYEIENVLDELEL